MKTVLAILNIFTESKQMGNVAEAISKLPEVINVYEVTGEFDLVALVSTETIVVFRDFLRDKVLKINGVKSTVTSIVLFTHKKDGKQISV